MRLFDVDKNKSKEFYHRAWLECNRDFVVPRKYPYLDKALFMLARENNCSYDEVLILAKIGKRLGRLRS